MNILVTGSNGFIGGHFCRYLKDHGDFVVGLDKGETPKKAVDRYIQGDIASASLPEQIKSCGVERFDAVVHMAADMRHEPYGTDVVGTNCVGTERLLEFCEDRDVPVFVQLSSLPVIGEPLSVPITEDHPLKPPTVYHVTKITQELLANYATYTFGLRTVSFRICSPIGIGVNPKTIFPTFVRKAVHNEDLTLTGKGSRMQTYIHVDDISQAVRKAVCGEDQGVYNLASNNLISNYDLAKKCIEVTGSSSRIVFTGTEDPMDDYRWEVSIEKIKKDTGYEPAVSIEAGIEEYAAYIREVEDKK